jgi:hypothetical protein
LLRPGHDGSNTGCVGEWSFFSFRKPLPVAGGAMLLGRGVDTRGLDARVSRSLGLRHALLTAERIGPALLGRYYCGLVEWTRRKLDPVRGPNGWRAADEDRIGATTLRALRTFDIDAIAERRCANYRALTTMIVDVEGVDVPFPDLPRGSVPLVLPVCVAQPYAFAAALWKLGVGAFLWPGFEVLDGVDWGHFPGTRRWLDSLVCLPIHQDLALADLERVRDACREAAALLRA